MLFNFYEYQFFEANIYCIYLCKNTYIVSCEGSASLNLKITIIVIMVYISEFCYLKLFY